MNIDEARPIFIKARQAVAMASPEWSRLFDLHKKRPQVAAKDPITGEFSPIATIERRCPVDDEEILFHARDYLEASVTVAEAAFKTIRDMKQTIADLESRLASKARAKDYATQCAIACQKPAFRRFLATVHGADTSDRTRTETRVRSMLSIKSRAELNTDQKAADSWLKLHREFLKWEKGQ